MKKKTSDATVPSYISAFPKDVQQILRKIRSTIRKAAPKAEESISYGIPTYKFDGPLIYFAAFKSHIGLYPMTKTVKEKFRDEIAGYKQSKGTIRLPLDEPIPYDLIARIVKFKMRENRETK